MKNTTVKIYVFAALAVLLIITAMVLGITDGLMILALPFTLLGKGLRMLSLSGSVGNVAAIVLYVIICLLPLLLKIRSKWKKKDILLLLCSDALFYVVYYMINPSYRPAILQNDTGSLSMAGVVYSLLLCWLVLTLMESFRKADNNQIYAALRIFLILCMAEFSIGIIVSFSDCITSIQKINTANTAPGLNLTPTYIFVVLSFAATALEYSLNILLFHLSGKLVKQLQAEAYSDSCYKAAQILSAWCSKSLIILIVSTTMLNVAQLIFASVLHSVDIRFHLPTASIGLAFVLLAITRLLYQGKVLKEDNDLFI